YRCCCSCRTRRCREPTKKFDGGRRRNGEFVIALMKQNSDFTAAKTAVQGYGYGRNCLDPRRRKTKS
ncbi:unnamed protein product, partial [Arabidopsis halleri]